MHTALIASRRLLAISPIVLMVGSALAGPPSDTLLPRTTKGYVSVAHPKQFAERWDKTQIGQLFNDEIMQAFVQDFNKQLDENFGTVQKKLGFDFDDLKDVTAGEMSLSVVERKGQEAALAITMDITGHKQQADGFLAAVEKRFAARKGRKTTANAAGTTLLVFNLPKDTHGKTQQTVYFIKDNVLCGIDDLAEAQAMVKRFAGDAKDNLKSVKAYTATMERCRREAKDLEPEARFFVEPFAFIFAVRTLRETPRNPEQDTAKILYENGFDAVQGAGGYFNQIVDSRVEMLLRTSVYAPPVPGKENDPLRWNLSMRTMQLPNGQGFEPQSWVPRMSASYTTMNWQLGDAFDNVGPLFDAVQDHRDAWKNTLDAWQIDPYGPQVDMRKNFIANMGNRVTVVTDYDVPITENSERAVFAIEATDEKALSETLEKWMKNETDVVRREVGQKPEQYVIWERLTRTHDVEEPEVDVPGFTPVRSGGTAKGFQNKKRERVLPNSAVTVALGHLLMASDINYLTQILEGFGQRERLASSTDYQQLLQVMNELAPGERSAWAFGRSDEEIRPSYDLVRQGKMPDSKSMFGKLLNQMLTTEQERQDGVRRRQRIDGNNLPDFEAIRRYLGPHARVVRSEKDGWFVTGALVNKEAP